MKKGIVLYFLFLSSFTSIYAQIDGGLLLGLIPISNAEISTITGATEGSLFYNTDEQKIYVNTSTGFAKIPAVDTNSIDFWSALGSTGTDPSVNFLGTTDAQDMVFRANNQERLRLSGTNQSIRINGATQINNHPFIIRANGDDLIALQTAAGITEWHWNLLGNGLNFVETGIADYRIFLEQGGNIGLSTGLPTERLDVNGSLRVRTIADTTSDLDVLVTTATGVVQKRPFADFTSPGGISKLNYGGRWTNTDTATDLNVDNTVAPIFGNEDYKDDGNNLYEVSGNTLIVRETGRYDIRANISLLGVNVSGSGEQRTNVNARVAVNGTVVGALAGSGYIRYPTNTFNNSSSIHINEILELNADDIISIITFRRGNSGEVNFSPAGESSFMINKLR